VEPKHAENGKSVAAFPFTSGETFVNDVIVTEDAAYFTDSFQPVLYKVPLEPNGGPDPSQVEEPPWAGTPRPSINTNGHCARPLVIVNGVAGLYLVDPDMTPAWSTPRRFRPERRWPVLDGASCTVQNQLNQISV
jgi:hypothetical protein